MSIKVPRVPCSHGKKHRSNSKIHPDILHKLDDNFADKTTTDFLKFLWKQNKHTLSFVHNIILGGHKFANKKLKLLLTCFLTGYFQKQNQCNANSKKSAKDYVVIPFVNKGIELLKIHNIFKDKSLQCRLPIQTTSVRPVAITYQYGKPISSMIFNYSTVLHKVTRKSLRNNFTTTCLCSSSQFLYPPA